MKYLILVLIILTSCSRKIVGPITQVSGDTIQVKGKTFLIYNNKQKVGDTITLTPTRNRKKINSKEL